MKTFILCLACSFICSCSLFSQEKKLLDIEGISLSYNPSKYCEDFTTYGDTKINYDVYEVYVTFTNHSLETKFYNHAEFGIHGANGNCYTNFAVYGGRRGFPAGEKIEKIFYIYVTKGGKLPDPQFGLNLVPNGERPQEPYTEFQCPCLKLPPCEKKSAENKQGAETANPYTGEWTLALKKFEGPPSFPQAMADQFVSSSPVRHLTIGSGANGELTLTEDGTVKVFKKISENRYQWIDSIFTELISFNGNSSMEFIHIASPDNSKMTYTYTGTKN
ncbi:MAG: hypothetical protein WCK34_07045 [Bacteroidota bacterium]